MASMGVRVSGWQRRMASRTSPSPIADRETWSSSFRAETYWTPFSASNCRRTSLARWTTLSGSPASLATVSTDLLRDDIIQHQKELISLLRDISGLDGTVVFDIEVKEDRSAVRPVKPEDKLAHLRSKNAALDELRRELELELE